MENSGCGQDADCPGLRTAMIHISAGETRVDSLLKNIDDMMRTVSANGGILRDIKDCTAGLGARLQEIQKAYEASKAMYEIRMKLSDEIIADYNKTKRDLFDASSKQDTRLSILEEKDEKSRWFLDRINKVRMQIVDGFVFIMTGGLVYLFLMHWTDIGVRLLKWLGGGK
jgi:hypothetical protein